MFGIIKKIIKGVAVVGRIQHAISEGKDVVTAFDTLKSKYADFPEDVRNAVDELEEFVDAVRDIT